jgi:hypothetical protein
MDEVQQVQAEVLDVQAAALFAIVREINDHVLVVRQIVRRVVVVDRSGRDRESVRFAVAVLVLIAHAFDSNPTMRTVGNGRIFYIAGMSVLLLAAYVESSSAAI